MLKLFSCDYDHYNIVRCRQNVNFEEFGTQPSIGKNDGLWEICKEYIQQNIIMAVLRKANFYSVDVCRLIKKKNQYCKRKSKAKKLIQTLIFPNCLVLMRF